jgi:hypothetical protein
VRVCVGDLAACLCCTAGTAHPPGSTAGAGRTRRGLLDGLGEDDEDEDDEDFEVMHDAELTHDKPLRTWHM